MDKWGTDSSKIYLVFSAQYVCLPKKPFTGKSRGNVWLPHPGLMEQNGLCLKNKLIFHHWLGTGSNFYLQADHKGIIMKTTEFSYERGLLGRLSTGC